MTGPDEFDRLADLVLDGVATEEEKARCERLMATDPVARSRFEEMRLVFHQLRAVPRRVPPPGVVAAALSDLRANAPRRTTARWDWRSAILGQPSVLRYGGAFALGLALGSVLVTASLRQPAIRDEVATSGTMIPNPSASRRVLQLPAGRMEATLHREGAFWVAAFSGQVEHAEMTIEHEAVLVSFNPPAGINCSLAPGRAVLNLTGAVTFRMRFDAGPERSSPIRIELRSGEQATHAELRLDEPRGSGP